MRERVVLCNYCGARAQLVDSKEVYSQSYGLIYLCKKCDAYVGVHKGTTKPLGRLANKTLRQLKQRAHAAFDPLWQAKQRRDGCSKSAARHAGYKWLAEQMHIDPRDCHIGMFTESQCEHVVEICKKVKIHG